MSIREYKSEPCPICGHKGWCGLSDEDLILCKRPPSPPETTGYIYKGLAKDGATAMYVEAGKEHRSVGRLSPISPPPVSSKTLEEVHETAVASMTSQRRSSLAIELGLPESVLSELAIGWSDTARHHADRDITGAYVFPEYNGQGFMVGTSYRFPADRLVGLIDESGKTVSNKSGPARLRRGLVLPLNYKEMSDPVLAVEGASDVLAGRAVGLSVIGRPSNTGGVEFIAQICQHRRVIILGENDRKPDGRWPGKEGAETVASRLETTWGRPVPVAFPPENIKDLRDWVRLLVPQLESADLAAVRRMIIDAIQPPGLLLLARPCDKRGRAEIRAFRWTDGAEAVPVHSDRLHFEEATARKRFVKALVKAEPAADADDLQRRLLALKVPGCSTQKLSSAPSPLASSPHGSSEQPTTAPAAADPEADSAQLPEVFLPGGSITILSVGDRLGQLLARTGRHYVKGGATVAVAHDGEGLPILEPLRPSTLASVFETVAQLMCYFKKDGVLVPAMTICSEQEAKMIQHSPSFQSALPPIHLLSRCPVLVERGGTLVTISGYDRDSGVLAFGEPAIDMPLEDAVVLLSDMLADFRFATAADRARALAAVVTPAMVFGNLLGGRAPVDLGEADASQSGKGYRAKLTAAIYGSAVKTITQRKGGVGSMEESFATALVQGFNFISFDNVRSAVDSPALESFLTEDSFLARVPHMAAIEVDPRLVIVQLTSNKAEITVDLANRSACVRILKQPEGYRFRRYPEGSVLDHVRANQPVFLGAVFAVVKAWHAAGKPQTDTTGHDFRAWAGRLDWIVQNIFEAGPLLEGHRQTQIRMATPVLNWLRDVALAVRNKGHMGIWLRAGDLIDIISESIGIELPGLPEGCDMTDDDVKKKVLQAIGRRMAQCFGSEAKRTLDGFEITRQERTDMEHARVIKEYRFQPEQPKESISPYAQPSKMGDRGSVTRTTPETTHATTDSASRAPASVTAAVTLPYGPPMLPLCDSPMKMAISPMAPIDSEIAPGENGNTHAFQKVCEICADSREVIETIGGIGESGETPRLCWRRQAQALIGPRSDEEREDLLHLFDEREAIASIDGGQDEDHAGRLAYDTLKNHLREESK